MSRPAFAFALAAILVGTASASAQSSGAAGLIGNTLKQPNGTGYFDPSGAMRSKDDDRKFSWSIEAPDRLCIRATAWAADRKECVLVSINGTAVTMRNPAKLSEPAIIGELMPGNPLGL